MAKQGNIPWQETLPDVLDGEGHHFRSRRPDDI